MSEEQKNAEEAKDAPPAEEKPEAAAEGEAPAEGAEEEEEKQSVHEFNMAVDEFYPEGHSEKTKKDSALSRRSMAFYEASGQSSFKRYNFHWLGDNNFIYAVGNTYQMFDAETGERQIFHGTDQDGVGSVTVHPSKKFYVVAEKGVNPNVYIYEYPTRKLYRILRNATEKAFAHVEFSADGNKLATLGSAPDYTLTVWDWVNERVVQSIKAFSQEIYKVSFSPFTDAVLFTCGQTHIKFWKMAQTFTGLKLQGQVAKFGSLELSNVSALAELPDGKVVSGTTYGNLIIWEGEYVKTQLMSNVEEQQPLHDGPIEVLISEGEYFISAGGDGYIKWWRQDLVDQAEAEEGLDFEMKPVKQIRICAGQDGSDPAFIMNMTKAIDDKWYIQDLNGHIFVLDETTGDHQSLVTFHKGAINAITSSPTQNYVVTFGEDGMVKTWDYSRKAVAYQKRFEGSGTCLEHMPNSDANKGRICAAGFDNGIVRVLSMTIDGVQILKSFKAHDEAITVMKYSADLKMLVTASEKGDIFFFVTDGSSDLQKYDPLVTYHLADTRVNTCMWNPDDQSVVFSCSNGCLYKVARPDTAKIDNQESYYWSDAVVQEWVIKIMDFQMQKNQKKDPEEEEKKRRMRLRGELPPEEEEEEEVWEPQSLATCIPFNSEEGKNQYLVSTEGNPANNKFRGFLYVADFDEERPVQAIPCDPDAKISHMSVHQKKGGDMITVGYEDGQVDIICERKWDKRMTLKNHDVQIGPITSMTFNHDETFFFTVGKDGVMFSYQFDKLAAMEEVAFEPLANVEGAQFLPEEERQAVTAKKIAEFHNKKPVILPDPSDDTALDSASMSITLKTKEPLNKDVEDPTAYSIQQAKLRTEEDHRLNLAEKKKNGEREKITGLRGEFDKLVEKNNDAEEHIRITADDFQIDAEFFLILQERNDNKIEETKKEEAWDIEYNTVALNKLKNKYYDVLEFEKFTVKAIQTPGHVTTFRVQRMSEFLQSNIEAFKQMLETEIVGKDEDADDLVDEGSNEVENVVDIEKQKEKEKQAAILAKQKAQQQALQDAKKTEGQKKREQRKVEREKRWGEIEKLRRLEVMQNEEDNEDRAKIEEAMATYGDYKLKVYPEYTVPENQRINFQKKRQQMVLLQGSIHKLKVDFNQKIQELKIRKKQIIDHVGTVNSRLAEINGELGSSEQIFVPTIDYSTEYPENFFEIKEQDIEDYKQEQIRRAELAKSKGKKKAAQEEVKPEEHEAADEAEEAEEKEEWVPVDLATAQAMPRKGKVQQTDFDEEYDQIRKIELQFEKEQKKKEVEELITTFDEEIAEMQKEKYRLESDLKNAEMKFILFYEELILLKSMEAKDQRLTRSLAECRKHKGNILRDITEISRQLKGKEKEIAKIAEVDSDLMIKFHELCPERSDKYDIIRTFFEKNVKRKTRKEKVEKAEDEEGEEDEEEEDVEEEDDDEDEDEDENAFAGLSPEEYKLDEIEKLRDQRLELMDEKLKIQDFIRTLEEKRKRLEQTEKTIKSELEETEEEIQDFQSEKMSKLNELRIAVVLKMKQLQHLLPDADQNRVQDWERRKTEETRAKVEKLNRRAEEEGFDEQTLEKMTMDIVGEPDWRGFKIPETLNGSILFTRTQLLQLIDRKREIDEEIADYNRQKNLDQKKSKIKSREIQANESKRVEASKAYDEKRMLRFGNLIDLDSLEVGGPSAVVIELQNKFNVMETQCFQQIEEADSRLDGTQRDLTEQMKKNTGLLDLIRTLGEKQHELEHKLTGAGTQIFVDEDEQKKMQAREDKNRIKNLLQTQAKEIETFKTEINMYKRKGGHIYTKVTTNRRVANLNQDN